MHAFLKSRFLCLSAYLCVALAQFEVPEALVEQLHPKGFSVSIPDEEGIKLFAFHGKLNEELEGREGGTFSRDIIKAKNGRWTFTDKMTKIKPGDVLYYWTYVDYFDGKNKLGYTRDDQSYTFKGMSKSKKPASTKSKHNRGGGNNKSKSLEVEGNSEEDIETKTNGGGESSEHKIMSSTTELPNALTDNYTIGDLVGVSSTSPPTSSGDGCSASMTKVRKLKICSGQVIFEDHFDNNVINEDKWEKEVIYAGEPDFEYTIYINDARNIYTERNMLHIKPSLTDERFGAGFVTDPQGLDLGKNCTGIPGTPDCFQKPQLYFIVPPVLSARINSRNSFSFVYGLVEIRAKLPKGDWIYPELYLNPKNYEYGAGFESGQIRIAFLPGNQILSKKLYGGCILGRTTAARNFAMKNVESPKNWNDDFHNFTMKWEPESISLFVDSELYGRIYPSAGGFATREQELGLTAANRWRGGSIFAPFDVEMYLAIGVGAGGHTFPDDPAKPWVNNDPKGQKAFYRSRDTWYPTWTADSLLQVDYVKVTAL